MKPLFIVEILILFLSVITKSQAQSITLIFYGNNNGQYVTPDSIIIQNLDKGCDTTLYYPNTRLTLQQLAIGDPKFDPIGFTVFQNVPNPSSGQTVVKIYQPETGPVSVIITELTGRRVASFDGVLQQGYHLFDFYAGSSGGYIFSASNSGLFRSILISTLKDYGNGTCVLRYSGISQDKEALKSIYAGGFSFSMGDHLRYTGYYNAFTSIIEDAPQSNMSYTFLFYNTGTTCPGMPTVTYGGQIYNTVLIGTQCWLRENLNIGTRINGNLEQTNNAVIEKYCYDDNESNCIIYGGLYQWGELMQYVTTQGAKGLCPDGWHIPTDAEWTTLTTSLGGIGVAGGKMKETGTAHWAWPNTGATNSSGFTALPGGVRNVNGSYDILTYCGGFWSSSQDGATDAWDRGLCYNYESVGRGNDNKSIGISVRCIWGVAGIPPTVTTDNVTNVAQTSATCGGNVTSQGSSSVTARGVCWSTSSNPTISDSHTTDGSGTGSFTSNLTGLTANTPYYVRAYATNSIGTAYGNQVSFTTSGGGSSGEPCPGIPIVTYGGQIYNTVLIGTQCWFKENLNIGTRINGSQNQTNNAVIEKYCYDDNEVNCTTYGGLYQWDEMMQYVTIEGSQGICPSGWHLPSDAEWTSLINYLGGDNVAGGQLKEVGFSHWSSPNTGATDESGFTALPGGVRYLSGSFFDLTYYAVFWSSSQYDATDAGCRSLGYDYENVGRYYDSKTNGFSCRCIRD